MYDFIKKNLEMLGVKNVQMFKMDVFQYLQNCNQKYDIIFAGPPYALNTIDELPKIIVSKKLIDPEGYFILEHTPRNNYEKFEGYSFQRNYGTTIFSFFECRE
jgi:16S rRNA G966 N2-methylase RsmD